GGGAIGAVAKLAGISAARGFTADNHPLSSAVRRAVSLRPPAAAVEDVKLVSSVATPAPEIDDWILSGEEEIPVTNSEPMPRVVFGGVPTLQEAEEATSELSSLSIGTSGSLLPAPALMAFRFLNESPAVQVRALTKFQILEFFCCLLEINFKFSIFQNVVASIASDPNVWQAVLQNSVFQDYLKSSDTACETSSTQKSIKQIFEACFIAGWFPAALLQEGDSVPEAEGDGRTSDDGNFFDRIKRALCDMMTTLSDFFGRLFGGGIDIDFKGTSFYGIGSQNVVFGLALMVITVVVLKRA
ncbi:hypothetical protein M569_08551, partial [Genlisea aurea]